ncbi:hypothetical protein ES703_70050 [subsurface metagenome]
MGFGYGDIIGHVKPRLVGFRVRVPMRPFDQGVITGKGLVYFGPNDHGRRLGNERRGGVPAMGRPNKVGVQACQVITAEKLDAPREIPAARYLDFIIQKPLRIFVGQFDHCFIEGCLGNKAGAGNAGVSVFPTGIAVRFNPEAATFDGFQLSESVKALFLMEPTQGQGVNARVNFPPGCRPTSGVQDGGGQFARVRIRE